MQQVSEHVWAEVDYDGANVGVVVGDRGLVLVEAPMCPGDARDWLEKVRSVSDKDILYVVTTDQHFDHSVCASMLCPNLIMQADAAVGLENDVKGSVETLFKTYYPERFEEMSADIAQIEIIDPLVVFDDGLTIDLGNVRVEMIHCGGHARGTSFVFVVEDRTLFAGDNVTNDRHAYMGEMSLAEWLEALDCAATLMPKVVVPGHGDVGDIEAVHAMNRFFTRMKELVCTGIANGLMEDEVVRGGQELVSFFPIVPGREEMTPQWVEEGLRRSYQELKTGLLENGIA